MKHSRWFFNRLAAIAAIVIFYHVPALADFHQSEGSVKAEFDSSLGCKAGEPLCIAPQYLIATEQIQTLTMPPYDRMAARSVTYSVETRGNITADFSEFKKQTNDTLNDTRGWSRLGVVFKEVSDGGDFTLVLSEASQVPSFSPNGCDSTYSCNVGRFVIINQDRWLGATESWNNGGGSIRDYRHMVLNHETGHWLGQGHTNCGGPGQPAAVMQQQSMDLQGCRFNPWPLSSEIYSPKLGL